MDRAVWQRIEPLVDQALDLSDAERADFLADLGARDPPLRDAVAAFLAAESTSREFLVAPVDARAGALLRAIGDDDRSWDAVQLEGTTIGPYRLVREVGRGGMGAVFLAERGEGGFEQRVAVKLVKRGMDTAEILARFQNERQILARLEHPHISRLLDGGVTSTGQSYFAMEFVDGTPLSLYCDRHRLSIEGRLRLLLDVCGAVEFAHRNLVVHRDLKPSNILVTTEGQAKLLDFGIAKVLDPALADGSPTVTRRDARAVTPQYAAPELLLGEPVTTATDVYSLGVILYELLCGRLPYRLSGLGLAEVEKAVLKREAQPPSAAVRRAETTEADASPAASADEIAAARGLSPERLSRRLRGDLDNVAAMALRKEPTRRYASVAALADDLRRFLDGRPVLARGDRLGYRASKFIRRHKTGVAAAALLVASVAAGIVSTVWQAREALRQASRAEEVKRFAFSLFELSDPDAAKGRQITARELLERGAQRVEAELAGQPALRAEMLIYLGTIHHHLGLDQQGRPLFEKALAIRREHLGHDALAVSEAEVALGSSHLTLGELAEAEILLDRAWRSRRAHLGEDHADTAMAGGLLAQARLAKGELPEAERLLRQAIAIQRRHLPSSADELATNLNALGSLRQTLGDFQDAERCYREGLAIRVERYGEEHSSVASSLFNLAALMKDRGDVDGAEREYRRVLAIHKRLFDPDHEAIATDLNNLAMAVLMKGRLVEAEGLLRESLEIQTRLYGDTSPQLVIGLHNLAQALRWQQRFGEAEPLSRSALALAVPTFPQDHASVAAMRQELAYITCGQGRLRDAEELARLALASYEKELGPDHPRVAGALVTLGHVLTTAGRAAEAERLLQDGLRLRLARFGDGDVRTAEARLELVESLLALGRHAEAEAQLALGFETLEDKLGPAHPLTVRALAARDRLRAQGRQGGQ